MSESFMLGIMLTYSEVSEAHVWLIETFTHETNTPNEIYLIDLDILKAQTNSPFIE